MVTLQLLSPEKSDPNTLGLELKVVDFCEDCSGLQLTAPGLELKIQITADSEMGVHIVLKLLNDAR